MHSSAGWCLVGVEWHPSAGAESKCSRHSVNSTQPHHWSEPLTPGHHCRFVCRFTSSLYVVVFLSMFPCCWLDDGNGIYYYIEVMFAHSYCLLYILACFTLHCCLLGPLLCIVSFRCYVFCLLVVLVKLSVLAKWLVEGVLSGNLTVVRGFWRQRADERLGDPPPKRWIQEPSVVRDRVGRPQDGLAV